MTAQAQDLRGRLHQQASSALEPMGRLLSRWGLSPNHITAAGLLIDLFSAFLVVDGALTAAGIFWFIAGILDLLDGSMARGSGKGSTFGAYLDSTADRISDGAIFVAIIYYFANLGQPISAAVAAVALLGASLTSYARARALSLTVECKGGLITRGERVILVGIGLCFGWLEIIVYLLAITSAFTVAQRIYDAKRQLD